MSRYSSAAAIIDEAREHYPSPAGVGYVAADLPAIVSADLVACPCGWPQAPTGGDRGAA